MSDRTENPQAITIDELPIELPGKSANSYGPTHHPLGGDTSLDWRTIDPSTIQGDDIPVEELRHYQKNIDKMMCEAPGQYVLIAGREILAYLTDLESAASEARRRCEGRSFLIKKVAWLQPVQTFGGIFA
jgi:hypothetical protein